MQYDPRFRATHFELRIARDLPVLVVEPGHLSEILMNLMLFAVGEVAAGPPRLVVEAAVRGHAVILRVGGGSAARDAGRLEHTRRLAQGMGGQLSEAPAGGGCEVVLPAPGAGRSA
jgi:hypothetical protein